MTESLDISEAQSTLSDLLRNPGDPSSADESNMHSSYGEDIAGLAVALTALERHGWINRAPAPALEAVMRAADDYGDKETAGELSRELKRRGVETDSAEG